MAIGNKIKAMVKITGKNNTALTEYLGLAHPQSLNNKFTRDSWTVQDLIKVVSFLGGEITIKINDTDFTLSEYDLKSNDSRKVEKTKSKESTSKSKESTSKVVTNNSNKTKSSSKRIPLTPINIDELLNN